MKKFINFLILGLLLTGVSFTQEVNFSGTLGTTWGSFAPGTEKAGDFSTGKTYFTGELKVYEGDVTAYVEGGIGYDFITNDLALDLSETYIDYSSSFWGFRIGPQKVAWGKADGVNITNSVFPTDSTSLINDDNSVAIKAARLSFTGNSFTVDGFLIPFFLLEQNCRWKKKILLEKHLFHKG